MQDEAEPAVGGETAAQRLRERLLRIGRTNDRYTPLSKVDRYRRGGDKMRWTDLCGRALDWLNNVVPNKSVDFNFHDLVQVYPRQMPDAGGNELRFSETQAKFWVPHMNDRAMTDRHHIFREIRENKSGGRWRLFERLPNYAKPWETETMAKIKQDYHDFKFPLDQYFKHLFLHYEGEVAQAWDHWTYFDEPLPRNTALWHHQFGRTAAQRIALKNLGPMQGKRDYHANVDLDSIGSTMILYNDPNRFGHWRLNGGAITLPGLFYTFGMECTAYELMFWYWHAEKVVKKCDHASNLNR